MDRITLQKRRWLPGLLLLAANFLLFLNLRLLSVYDEVNVAQFLYHAQTSGEGADGGGAADNVLFALGGGAVLTLFLLWLYAVLAGRSSRLHGGWYARYCAGRLCVFFRLHGGGLAAFLLCLSCLLFLDSTNVLVYIGNSLSAESTFIERQYVDPRTVQLTFPAEKRNLIHIYLESMENTFSDTDAGDPITEDYIPELTALARQNTSFSHMDGMGGPLPYAGTTWTAAALVAQTAGVPIKTPLFEDGFGEENKYLPGATTLGDILDDAGYRQVFLLGSNAEFADKELYFTGHGEYEIMDLEALKEEGDLPADYDVWWGCEDE